MMKTIFCITLLLQLHNIRVQSLNSDSHYKFAWDSFKSVNLKHLNANVVMSPASVQTCMALAYMGAEGDTAAELRKGLYLETFDKKQDVAADYEEFLKLTTKAENSKLVMANRVFLDHRYEILPAYNEISAKSFDSNAELVSFTDNKSTADKINAWVESKTQHKITNLIDESSLDADTAAIIANAIYFKAEWKNKFGELYTKNREFATSATEKAEVPMMFRENMQVLYAEAPEFDATAISLPYDNSDLSMFILLPNKVDGLKRVVENFNLDDYKKLIGQFRNEKIDVYLPKFKIEFDLSLKDSLKQMGMPKLFDEAADLSGMLKTVEPLKISDVRHKAYIEVNEQGSEAAGASYLPVSFRTIRRNPVVFKVDHPFLFAIVDSNGVYFIGHVVKL